MMYYNVQLMLKGIQRPLLSTYCCSNILEHFGEKPNCEFTFQKFAYMFYMIVGCNYALKSIIIYIAKVLVIVT